MSASLTASTGKALPTDDEQIEELLQADQARLLAERRADEAARLADAARREAETERQRSAILEAEVARHSHWATQITCSGCCGLSRALVGAWMII
jgi:hypothetical protein